MEDEHVLYTLGVPPIQLTEYEVRVLATLCGGECSPSEISQTTGIPRTKTYDVLNSLVQKRLAVKTNEKPLTFGLAIDGIEIIRQAIQEAYQKTSVFLDQLQEKYGGNLVKFVVQKISRILQDVGFTVSSLDSVPGVSITSPTGLKIMVAFVSDDADLSACWKYAIQARSKGLVQALVFIGSKSVLKELVELSNERILSVEYDALKLSEALPRCISELEEVQLVAVEKQQEYDSVVQRIQRLASEAQVKMGNLQQEKIQHLKEETTILLDHKFDMDLKWRALHRRSSRRGCYDREDVEEMEEILWYSQVLEGSFASLVEEMQFFSNYLTTVFQRSGKVSVDLYFNIFNQESFRQGFEGFIRESLKVSGISTAVVTGSKGVGKTLFQRYFTTRLNSGEFGKCISVYTKMRPSFVDLFNDLIFQIACKLIVIRDTALRLDLFKPQRTYVNMVKAFRDIMYDLKRYSFKRVFWFIDDLDELPVGEAGFISQLMGFTTSLQEEALSVTATVTPEKFSILSEDMETTAFLSQNVHALRPFVTEDVVEIMRSLKPFLLRSIIDDLPLLAERIMEVTSGNPGRVIKIMNDFGLSAQGGKIDKEFVELLIKRHTQMI